MSSLKTIDDVLESLDSIIYETERNNDSLGYFAVLYRRVTWKVKEGIRTGYFDDPRRMEALDVLFASRYIDAYNAYRKGEPYSLSWQKAFELSEKFWPIVLQHLLIGMNAHINLDLGIAAVQVSSKGHLEELWEDFYRINKILSSLVEEVQENLSTLWPPLRHLLRYTGQLDNLMTDFSMNMARDGAWRFAQTLKSSEEEDFAECIRIRDETIAKTAGIIINHKPFVRMVLGMVRLGEIGSTQHKIRQLKRKLE